VNDAEWKDLKRRMDEDCDRVSAHVAHERTKRAATKKPRKVSWKKFVEKETWAGVKKDKP
jgi:hypothetical protein